MTLGISIRRPHAGDFDSALACLQTYRVHPLGESDLIDPDFPGEALLSVRNKVLRIDFDVGTWVAVRKGEVLGFCCWAWLDYPARIAKTVLIATRQEARKLGVGDLLQQARQEDMSASGAREVHTWCDDARVVTWYCRKYGYQSVGVEPVRHTLHLFTCGSRFAWCIHRGHVQQSQLTHLRLDLTKRDLATTKTLPEG